MKRSGSVLLAGSCVLYNWISVSRVVKLSARMVCNDVADIYNTETICELSTKIASFPAGLRNLRGWETKLSCGLRMRQILHCYFRAIPCFITSQIQFSYGAVARICVPPLYMFPRTHIPSHTHTDMCSPAHISPTAPHTPSKAAKYTLRRAPRINVRMKGCSR